MCYVHIYKLGKNMLILVVKINIEKTYDSISKNIIINIIKFINFPETFIRWTKSSICSPHISFVASMDMPLIPISHYLFIIVQ